MKIEIIEATATMPKGTIKDVSDNVAKVMIANNRAKAVEEKPKKATKKKINQLKNKNGNNINI